MVGGGGGGVGPDLSYEGEDAKAGHLDQGDRASAHPSRKLGGVAGLGRLSQECGEAADEAAAQHDGAAQNLYLTQDLVHLMQCLQEQHLHQSSSIFRWFGLPPCQLL